MLVIIGVGCLMYSWSKIYTCKSALKRRFKNIFYGAMFMLLADLRFVCVSMVGMVYGVRMRVQLQYKRIWHHGSGKEQEQYDGDITG